MYDAPSPTERRSAAARSAVCCNALLHQNASGNDTQRGDDARHGVRKIAAHQLRRNPQHAIPEPTQVAVPARIRRAVKFIRPIIHFNYQFCGGRKKICDVTVNRNLTTKSNAELLTSNSVPKYLLGLRQNLTKAGGGQQTQQAEAGKQIPNPPRQAAASRPSQQTSSQQTQQAEADKQIPNPPQQ